MSVLLRQLLIEEESWRNKAYPDSKGILTIGVGHNLQDKGVSNAVVELFLSEDMTEAESEAAAALPDWSALNEVRQAVLAGMFFQMGPGRVKGFVGMLAALRAGDYQRASAEMLDSEWARNDSPKRAQRAARMMYSGVWEPHQ